MDQNDVDLRNAGHYVGIYNVDQDDFYKAQIRLYNLTETTILKLRVKNDVGQVEALIEVKVESSPESIPAIDAAALGQIPLWVIILVVITVLLIIGLLGFGICKVKKSKESETTEV